MGTASKFAAVTIAKPSTGTTMTISARTTGSPGNAITVMFWTTNDTGALTVVDGTPQDFSALTPVGTPVLEIFFGYVNPSPTFQQIIDAINATSTLCSAMLVTGSGSDVADLSTLSSPSMTYSTAGEPPWWTFPPPGPPVIIARPPVSYFGLLSGGADGFSDDSYKAKVMRGMLAPPWDRSFRTPMCSIITVIGGSDNDLGGLFGRDDFLPDEDT